MNGDKFEGLVKSLSRQYVANGVDLEDLEQEARLAVFLGLQSYPADKENTEPAVKNYLTGRIKNALSEYRRRNSDDAISLDEEIERSGDSEPGLTRHDILKDISGAFSAQEDATKASRTKILLDSLPEQTREIISLRAQGWTWPEIGKRFNQTDQAVKKTYQRAQPIIRREAA